MNAGLAVLLVLALLTALNWGVHYYTQTVTYRLFPQIAAAAGDVAFVAYHRAYERQLPWSVYLPWSALMAGSAAFVAVRPAGLGVGWSIVLLVLNGSIAPLSLLFAAPVHRRVDATGRLTQDDAAALMRWNGVRLAVATVSLLTVGTLGVARLAVAP